MRSHPKCTYNFRFTLAFLIQIVPGLPRNSPCQQKAFTITLLGYQQRKSTNLFKALWLRQKKMELVRVLHMPSTNAKVSNSVSTSFRNSLHIFICMVLLCKRRTHKVPYLPERETIWKKKCCQEKEDAILNSLQVKYNNTTTLLCISFYGSCLSFFFQKICRFQNAHVGVKWQMCM